MALVQIAPDSQRAIYYPGEQIEFTLPAQGILQPGAQLQFLFSAGRAANYVTATALADGVRLGEHGGAFSIIKEIRVQTGKQGVIDRVNHYGRTMGTLVTCLNTEPEFSNLGALALVSATPLGSINALVGTSNTNADVRRKLAYPCSLPMDLTGGGLFSQAIDLSATGAISVVIQLAQPYEAMVSTGAGKVTDYGFSLAQLYLSCAITPALPNPKAVVPMFRRMECLTAQVDAGRKVVTFAVSSSTACVGVVASFLPTSSMNAADQDASILTTPPGLTSVKFGFNDSSSNPLQYTINVLSPGSAWEQYPELWLTAAELFTGTKMANKGAQLMLPTSTQGQTSTEAEKIDSLVIGVRFDAPRDLTKHAFSVEVVSAVTSAAPYTMFLHFVNAPTAN